MSLTGVVVPGSPLSPGGTLLSDVLATDTVLPLDDAADFAESFDEPRWLVIGGETTPREYVAVQNDEEAPPESVTLKVAVGGSGFEAGLPVTPWDPGAEANDKRAVTWRLWVQLDGFADKAPVPVFVEQNRVPTASDFSLEGARVELTEDDLGDLWVERVLGRVPVLSSEFQSLALIGKGGRLYQETDDGRLLYQLGDLTPMLGATPDPLDEGSYFYMTTDGDPATSAFSVGSVLPGSPSSPNFPDGYAAMKFLGDLAYFFADVEIDLDLTVGGGYFNTNWNGGGTTDAEINDNGRIGRKVSSRRYKHDIADLDLDPATVLALRPVAYRRRDEGDDNTYAGFIAEEAADLGLDVFVARDKDGQPDGFHYGAYTAALQTVVRDQQARIERLEEQVAALLAEHD